MIERVRFQRSKRGYRMVCWRHNRCEWDSSLLRELPYRVCTRVRKLVGL
jgi:hypothetical protein